jgi:hypothetical protein
MPINFSAIQDDINRLNKKTSKDSAKNDDLFWKPEKEHIIRIVPYPHDSSDSLRRIYFHYGLSEKPIVSPVTYGMDDPIMQWAKKLQAEGNKDSWIRGKKLEPKLRVYAPILVRGEESKGVRFYGFTEAVYATLAKFLNSGDYGDISDLTNGNDIYVEYHKKQGDGYPSTSIMIKPNKTAAFSDNEVGAKALSEVPKLEDIFKAPTKEELIKVLENYLYPKPNTDFVDKAIGNHMAGNIAPTFTPNNSGGTSQSLGIPSPTVESSNSSNAFSSNPMTVESPQVSNAMLEFERLLNSK